MCSKCLDVTVLLCKFDIIDFFSFNILGLSLIAIADGWGEKTNFLDIKDGSITVTAWDLTGLKKNEIVIKKRLQEVETAKYLLTENLATGNLINVQVLYLNCTY